jgi:hypothetical protein
MANLPFAVVCPYCNARWTFFFSMVDNKFTYTGGQLIVGDVPLCSQCVALDSKLPVFIFIEDAV